MKQKEEKLLTLFKQLAEKTNQLSENKEELTTLRMQHIYTDLDQLFQQILFLEQQLSGTPSSNHLRDKEKIIRKVIKAQEKALSILKSKRAVIGNELKQLHTSIRTLPAYKKNHADSGGLISKSC